MLSIDLVHEHTILEMRNQFNFISRFDKKNTMNSKDKVVLI